MRSSHSKKQSGNASSVIKLLAAIAAVTTVEARHFIRFPSVIETQPTPPMPGDQVATRSSEDSPLKVFTADYCVQGTLAGPISCEKKLEANDLTRQESDGSQTTLTHLRARSIFKASPGRDGLLQVCHQKENRSAKHSRTVQVCNMYHESRFVNRFANYAPLTAAHLGDITSDVSVGDPALTPAGRMRARMERQNQGAHVKHQPPQMNRPHRGR